MMKMTKVLMVGLITVSANAAQAAGYFDQFLGSYTVQSSTCGDTDVACKEVVEVRVEYLPTNSFDPNSKLGLYLTEASSPTSYVSHPLSEYKISDPQSGSSQTAEINGGVNNASWMLTNSFSYFANSHTIEIDLRSFYGDGTKFSYSFTHKEDTTGSIPTHFQVDRSYQLVKKP